MPHTFYTSLWIDAQKDLDQLLVKDKKIQHGKPIKKPPEAIKIALELYLRYRKIVQRLTDAHDQLVQPQIRELAGKMLDYSIVRMLEYRQEVVGLTLAECPWPNEILKRLKFTPQDVELTGPVYNAAERKAEFNRRKKIVDDMINEANKQVEEDFESEATSIKTDVSQPFLRKRKQRSEAPSSVASTVSIKETPEEKAAREAKEAAIKRFNDAIQLIQKHERARVSRRTAIRVEKQIEFNRRVSAGEIKVKEYPKYIMNEAAIVIQKAWRGFVARREVKKLWDRKDEALGMVVPYWKPPDLDNEFEEFFEERLEMQKAAVDQMNEVTQKKKEKIYESRGPSLIEDIRSEIHEWFMMWFDEVGFFDQIPREKDGGSQLIATGQARTPKEYLQSATAGDSKDKKKKDKDKEEDEDEEKPEPEGWVPKESKVFEFLIKCNEEFRDRWLFRIEQILDRDCGLLMDLIEEEIYKQLQLDMRLIADDQMREELSHLNRAILEDHKKDSTFTVPSVQIFDDPDAPPKKRHKKKIDPHGHISEDELMMDLINWDVIKEYPNNCRLSDWPGTETYAYDKFKNMHVGDIKHTVMDYCVLPIVSKTVNELAPYYKKIAIIGPGPSGQHFLADAICREARATVFDLTPEHHDGHFIGKKNTIRLVYAVSKLAKILAPSIILTESETTWLKKIPKDKKKYKPKRFGLIYKKIAKNIQHGDQVLFLTTSTVPYMTKATFAKFHDKFIIIPICDYGTMYMSYKKSLMKHELIDRHYDVSCLAKLMANDVPFGVAKEILDKTVGISRRCTFKRHPLRQQEILDTRLARRSPTHKDLDNFDKFRFSKIKMEKERKEILDEELKQIEELKKSAKKK